MAKKRTTEHTSTPIVEVEWVQLKVKVPKPVRDRFNQEADSLGKSNDLYFLGLWDLRDESYRKLLTQHLLEIQDKLKKK